MQCHYEDCVLPPIVYLPRPPLARLLSLCSNGAPEGGDGDGRPPTHGGGHRATGVCVSRCHLPLPCLSGASLAATFNSTGDTSFSCRVSAVPPSNRNGEYSIAEPGPEKASYSPDAGEFVGRGLVLDVYINIHTKKNKCRYDGCACR